MSNITPSAKGAALTFAAASGGGDVVLATPGKHFRIYVQNGDSSDKTVTIADTGACNRGYVHASTGARAIVCAHGKTTPVDLDSYEIDSTTGHAGLSWSAVTSVNVAASEV